MKSAFAFGIGIASVGAVIAAPVVVHVLRDHAKPGWIANEKRFTLPNGWRLTPAGKEVELPGDMPGNILFVDGGRRALVNTCGFHDHSLSMIDVELGTIVGSVPFKQSWMGLALQPGGDIFVAGGKVDGTEKTEAIHRVSLSGSSMSLVNGMNLPSDSAKGQFVSGLLVGKEGLYALDIQHDTVVLLDGQGSQKASAKVGYRPYGAALSPDGNTLAISNWGDKSVTLLDASSLSVKTTIQVKALPCALSYSKDGRLFVANSGSNDVSVIANNKVVETIRTGVDRTDRIGSTPSALAISPDSETLYVANSDNNCVSVVNISKPNLSTVTGFIPTGRYPSAIALTPNGTKLLVATGKGYYGPNAGKAVQLEGNRVRGKEYQDPFKYIGEQLSGHLEIINIPNRSELADYTKQTLENLPLGPSAGPSKAEQTRIAQDAFSKIKHVIYIIKENRTYDQVLGDIPKGNGDASLTIFGEKVTPNIHKIVNTFSLLDNLYTYGETSQIGHQWTDAAYANDYEEKQWTLSYSRRGEVESDKRLSASPGDYLWSAARKKGLWTRVYGEYVDVQEDHNSLDDPVIKADPEKYGYSATFEKIFARGGRDTEKVDDFVRELSEAEKSDKWPALMVMALPEDHTHGFNAGAFSPRAMVASNDLAVGKLVDAVSHSKFWASTAIFVIQDDAQDGPDHVDSHRTESMVVSPYVRRGIVDSTMYSTSSMLRTIELILDIPALSQYDVMATPMFASFTTKPNMEPFNAVPPSVDLLEKNPARTSLARRSAKLDFSHIDRADFNALNRLLWEGYRPGVPYPAPVHGR